MDPDLTRKAVLLALQVEAIRLCSALEAQGIPVLLLKGPVTSAWLYGGIDNRAYGDIDLLVAPSAHDAAVGVLRRSGYQSEHGKQLGIYRPYNESAWSRNGMVVDLHTTLVGIPMSLAETAAAEFLEASVPFAMHGATLRALSIEHRCLHAALHVAQSRADTRALRDLELALVAGSHKDWDAARAASRRIAPTGALEAGLARVHGVSAQPEGVRISVQTRLRAGGAVPEAIALAAVLALPARARLDAVHGWFDLEDGTAGAVQRLTAAARLLLGWGQLVLAAAQLHAERLRGRAKRRALRR